jgi:hypothetical protein
MPPFESFAHYLAYGATDQETFRELRQSYDGIVVPATIAAFQRQGTGGFVLSISATEQAPPYMIDPRFPLFQQAFDVSKKSHQALAELLGDQELIVHGLDPTPDAFPDERIEAISKKWVEFNIGYGANNEKFDKYAKRLNEAVAPDQAQDPEAVLAPYFACDGPADPWWTRSQSFYRYTSQAAGNSPCLRVVCASSATALLSLLEDLDEGESVLIWVSNLDEHRASSEELVTYRRAVERAQARRQETFALYGGFFSVLLATRGLRGASHGVGYSEHRNWRELPTAGAPPARFYLRRAHRYVAQDTAQILYDISPDLAQCQCEHCGGRAPVALDYHELMKHSVLCRKEEIERWGSLELGTAAELLEGEHSEFEARIAEATLLPRFRARAEGAISHMPHWVSALRA